MICDPLRPWWDCVCQESVPKSPAYWRNVDFDPVLARRRQCGNTVWLAIEFLGPRFLAFHYVEWILPGTIIKAGQLRFKNEPKPVCTTNYRQLRKLESSYGGSTP